MTQETPRLALTLDETTQVRFIELATTPQGESATTPVDWLMQAITMAKQEMRQALRSE